MFDIVGFAVLIALIAVFGFLTVRAWRVRNLLVRWGGVVISGLLTLITTALIVLALNGFSLLNQAL